MAAWRCAVMVEDTAWAERAAAVLHAVEAAAVVVVLLLLLLPDA